MPLSLPSTPPKTKPYQAFNISTIIVQGGAQGVRKSRRVRRVLRRVMRRVRRVRRVVRRVEPEQVFDPERGSLSGIKMEAKIFLPQKP